MKTKIERNPVSLQPNHKQMNPVELIEKYYIPGSELYQVLILHSRQVRDKALEITVLHPELNTDREFIGEAAMLHDIGIFMCNAPRIHCNGTHNYIEHGYLGAELLRKHGFIRHALVCERHTGAGISKKQIKERNLPLPQRDMCPVSIEEKIICYADKFYSKTNLTSEHSIEKILTSLRHFGEENARIFMEWHRIFG